MPYLTQFTTLRYAHAELKLCKTGKTAPLEQHADRNAAMD